MLSTFDILKPIDEYGTPIDSTVEYNFGLTLYVWFLSSKALFLGANFRLYF